MKSFENENDVFSFVKVLSLSNRVSYTILQEDSSKKSAASFASVFDRD